ncbi:MAG TPA: hypothetical protein VF199_03800 [Bacillales bacterium]
MNQNNNRITIRVNGKDKSAKQEGLTKEIAAGEEQNFHWMLPEQQSNITETVQKDWKTQHERRKKKRSPGGQAPKLPLHRKKQGRNSAFRKKKTSRHLPKKQWLSGFSAIIVGLVMGMIVLTMFTDHETEQASAKQKNNQMAETNDKAEASNIESFTDLGLTLQVVQGAAFSSMANGKSAVDNLRNSGFAAVLNQENKKVYMFIGVGTEEGNTEVLGKLYKQQGQDVWVKTLQIGTGTSQLNQETGDFLEAAKPVLQSLITGSVRGLTSEESVFTDSQWSQLEGAVQKLKSKVTEDTGLLLNDLEAAMAGFKDYRGKSDSTALWNAQQALLEAVLAYQAIIE